MTGTCISFSFLHLPGWNEGTNGRRRGLTFPCRRLCLWNVSSKKSWAWCVILGAAALLSVSSAAFPPRYWTAREIRAVLHHSVMWDCCPGFVFTGMFTQQIQHNEVEVKLRSWPRRFLNMPQNSLSLEDGVPLCCRVTASADFCFFFAKSTDFLTPYGEFLSQKRQATNVAAFQLSKSDFFYGKSSDFSTSNFLCEKRQAMNLPNFQLPTAANLLTF